MNRDNSPVLKSFIAEQALTHNIKTGYGLSVVRCQLITAFMRDVYLVTADQKRYIFYLYRHQQRTGSEIRAEWQFVDFLYAHGVAVAPAILSKSGEYVLPIAAPEGNRFGVLTTYVAGEHLRQRSSLEAVKAYGRLIAQIHTLADEMPFPLTRPVNDVESILKQSLAAFAAEVIDRPRDKDYLSECAAILLARIKGLPKEKPLYGMIHGDVIRTNAQVSEEGVVTVLDFDLCGLGWRMYDIASYLIVIRGLADELALEQAFLNGYQEVRPLTEIEQEMMPVFEAIRAIFSIGVPAMNVNQWGSAYLYAFLDDSMDRLSKRMKKIG